MKTRKTVLCGILAVLGVLAFAACNDKEDADNTLAEKLEWVKNADNVQNGETYTIEISGNESISPQTLSYANRSNITIILKGTGAERVVSLSGKGSLFTVKSGVTLVLDENITLQGRSNNNATLVNVNGGNLEIKKGAKIIGNSTVRGSGVDVNQNGTFIMNGGEISSNTVSESGGGVQLWNGTTFTMNGGTISGNTAKFGGGVSVYRGGIFTMNGGKISGNTASDSTDGGGGGVDVSEDGTFIMNGGEISGNVSSLSSGGVSMWKGTFTMNGGKISGNTAGNNGGGIRVIDSSIFTMLDGEISGNAAKNGGGVWVEWGGTFRIVAGTVYGSDAAAGLKNTIDDSGEGSALYVNATAEYGTFNGTVWTSKGNLTTTNDTIRVVNGELQ